MNSSKAALVGSEGGHPKDRTTSTNEGNRPVDDKQLTQLAEHITSNFNLATIALKTRVDCERDGDDFIPLDTAELIGVYRELLTCAVEADSADLDVYFREWMTTIREDGEEVFLPHAAAKPDDYRNALMVAAAEVSALRDALQDSMGTFVALTRQARNVGCDL